MTINKIPVLILILFPFFVNAQKLSSTKKQVLEETEKLKDNVHLISQQLWELSETALKEYKSAELLISVLRKEGFVIEEGVAGMPTAFVASYGTGKPVIGILAEYDALPGVGNAAVPYRQPRADGITDGHGCGHNLFGSACVNAAIAVRRIMEKQGIKGTLKLLGTPAEETLVGKVYMAKAGVFDDLDAALDWHPGTSTGVTYNPTLAMNNFEVEFFGQAAHGAADPWNGRSALDAIELMNHAVNMMREHVYPTTRIHYVMPHAGDAPNVVPEYAKVWYFVRDTTQKNVQMIYDWILRIAEGSALATRTTYKVYLIAGVHEYLRNYPIMQALETNLEIVGPPEFSEEEQDWGRKLQEAAGKDPKGFITELEKIPEDWEKTPVSGGSTDVAEVSYITPTSGFRVTTAPDGIPWHSWATTASHGTSAGFKGAEVAAKVLALTITDLLTDEQLLKDAKEYFNKKTTGNPYKPTIPVDQKVRLPE